MFVCYFGKRTGEKKIRGRDSNSNQRYFLYRRRRLINLVYYSVGNCRICLHYAFVSVICVSVRRYIMPKFPYSTITKYKCNQIGIANDNNTGTALTKDPEYYMRLSGAKSRERTITAIAICVGSPDRLIYCGEQTWKTVR